MRAPFTRILSRRREPAEMSRVVLFALIALFGLSAQQVLGDSNRVSFEEEFALSSDRAALLEKLIPGSEDYYYYQCLHAQHSEDWARVKELMPVWKKQIGETERYQRIQYRQVLLDYSTQPQRTLDFLRRQLQPNLSHMQQIPDAIPDRPTALDPDQLAIERWIQATFDRHGGRLDGFTDEGLWLLADVPLNRDQSRKLLERLRWPDYPGLVGRIVADLRDERRGFTDFGSLEIHRRLTLEQLDSAVALMPELLQSSNFVSAYIAQLAPPHAIDFRRDVSKTITYLDRLVDFSRRLGPVFNSFKAHALYHRLEAGKRQGNYRRELFFEYLKLPRPQQYVNADFLKRRSSQQFPARLQVAQELRGGFRVIGSDWKLVRDYLLHFFVGDESFDPFSTYIRKEALRDVFAEAKIVSGSGDPERWYSLMSSPSSVEALKNRIDLDFAPTNGRDFKANDPVRLALDVKNVSKLLVKIYPIHALNYYRELGKEIDASLSLDGLVALDEQSFDYEAPAWRRVRREFEFPQLSDPGVYVIEFLGAGRGSRAIVRKGRFHFTEEVSPIGHRFRVFDDELNPVPDARIWLDGHEFSMNDRGTIVLPFTKQPGTSQIVLGRGDDHPQQATLASFQHQAENYELVAGFHLENESLLAGSIARLLVSPQLYVAGERIGLSGLEDVRLIIEATDRDGISSRQEIPGFKIADGQISSHEFRTPARLQGLSVSLLANVKNRSQGQTTRVSASQLFPLETAAGSEQIESVFLVRTPNSVKLEVRGRSGETKQDREVKVRLARRGFNDAQSYTLKTNVNGEVDLGPLADIQSIEARLAGATPRSWTLSRSEVLRPTHVVVAENQTVSFPYLGDRSTVKASDFALFEIGSDAGQMSVFRRNRLGAVSIRDGFIQIEGLQTDRRYGFFDRAEGKVVRIKVLSGEVRNGRVFSEGAIAELSRTQPLHLQQAKVEGNEVVIRLNQWTDATRVHVTATHYRPARTIDQSLPTRPVDQSYRDLTYGLSQYLTGRDLGDEYRYILDRRDAPRYPGNLLARPGLLLNPWALRTTNTDRQDARAGRNFAPSDGAILGGVPAPNSATSTRFGRAILEAGMPPSLDFLPVPARILTNLVPDDAGEIRIPTELLADTPFLRVVAMDYGQEIARNVFLPRATITPRDLTLKTSLVPSEHYAEKKQISVVEAGTRFTVPELDSAQVEIYRDLESVYSLFRTLNSDSTFAEFEFLLRWPTLEPAKKQELYSKYACHELHFFLAEKDPTFFAEVVQPYLLHKKDPTFLDRYFAGEELREFLDPWRYGQLNTFERILLGQRLPGEAAATARHVKELADLNPIATGVVMNWFHTGVAGGALDTAGLPAASSEAPAIRDEMRKSIRRVERQSRGRRSAARKSKRVQPAQEKLAYGFDLDHSGDSEELDGLVDFYTPIEQTREYAENNYYHLPVDQQGADRVSPSPFWVDYALHRAKSSDATFVSSHFPAAARNFTEMVLALAVLDLPFSTDASQPEIVDGTLFLDAVDPLIVFHREIETSSVSGDTSVLASQNLFRRGDRYTVEGNVRRDKFVTGEFLTGVAYGSQVVATNPTSAPLELDVLLQIPRGAIPLLDSFYTRSRFVSLAPYATKSLETFFYFPRAGKFSLYPVHVTREGETLAFADQRTLTVVDKLSTVDTGTWEYISQQGTPQQVLDYLEGANPHRLDLGRVAWRLREAKSYQSFGQALLGALDRRKVYSQSLWAYSLLHNDTPRLQQYLRHQDSVYQRAGLGLVSSLVTSNPVERHDYQFLEYRPLVNARIHAFGDQRKIQNTAFAAQYAQFMNQLAQKSSLDDEDRLGAVYYLILQDRIAKAVPLFASVDRNRVRSKLQFDYATAYLDLFSDRPRIAGRIAAEYRDHPVDRWRDRFRAIENYLQPGSAETTDSPKGNQELAANEPTFDLRVEAQQIALDYRNLEQVQVNYYPMDIELLFSSQPFVRSADSGESSSLEQWAMILPTLSETRTLPTEFQTVAFDLPKQFRATNVIVEIVAAGKRRSRAYYSNTMSVTLSQNYGQLQVASDRDGSPLAKTYVKVYARLKDGSHRFYKDGYTDLQGRFDYVALSTNDLDSVDRFSLLVLHDDQGATIQETTPPRR